MHLRYGSFNNNYEQRKEVISSFPFVDETFAFNDLDGTSCNLLKLVKMCYPASIITFVSEMDMHNMPESRIRGVTFTTFDIIQQGV
jgi:hypothetical protein